MDCRYCIHRRETIQENESIKARRGSRTAINGDEGALFCCEPEVDGEHEVSLFYRFYAWMHSENKRAYIEEHNQRWGVIVESIIRPMAY